MRIAYLLHYNDTFENGVFKKVLAQTRTWVGYGNEVRIFMISRKQELSSTHFGNIGLSVYHYGPNSRFQQWEACAAGILQWKPDLVYFRYDLYYPALAKLAKKIPMFIEINTNDVYEYSLSSRYRDWYNRLTRSLLLNKARGLISVTKELQNNPAFAKFNKASVTIGNGIDLSTITPVPAPDNERARLVFIGTSGMAWHGVDKLILLAQHFVNWQFDIVGLKHEDVEGSIPQNVQLYGFLERSAYAEIISRADVAIGTLALHRNQMQEASPLKTREYLAYGIPVIIGYEETDFPEQVPFILRLPNTEDNVESNLSEIQGFVEWAKGNRVPSASVSHLDVSCKERQRVAFMRRVLEESKR